MMSQGAGSVPVQNSRDVALAKAEAAQNTVTTLETKIREISKAGQRR
jgi:hypothetical protein